MKNNPYKMIKQVKCDVCGQPVWVDKFGGGDNDGCSNCGWRQSEESADHPDRTAIRNIPSLNSARELYRRGKPLIASFEDFLSAYENYGELEFTYKQIRYGVWEEKAVIILHERQTNKIIGTYKDIDDLKNNAKIDGVLLKDLWVHVKNTDFLQE